MDDTDSFYAWLAMCIDEARAQDDMDAMLQGKRCPVGTFAGAV